MANVKFPNVSIGANSKIITINDGTSTATIAAGDEAYILGQLVTIESKNAAEIVLEEAWPSAQNNIAIKVIKTTINFVKAQQNTETLNSIAVGNFAGINKWLSEEGTVVFTDSEGNEYPGKTRAQMEADVDQLISDAQAVVDDTVVASMAGLNWPVLNSPVFHGFKKSKLCDTGLPDATSAVSWTRNSTKTGIRYGRVVTFGVDEPSETDKGWEISPQSTNLFIHSERLDEASWIKANVTASPNWATAPDGTPTADKLIELALTGAHLASQNVAFTAGQTYTASFYVKPAERSIFQISQSNISFADSFANFDLAAGEVTLVNNGTATIERLADGWFRCTLTAEATASATSGVSAVLQIDPNAARNGAYDGDGISGVYIWGAQLEALPFPTPYISTVGSTVTRLADIVSIDGANHPDVVTGQALTIAMSVELPPVTSPATILFTVPNVYSWIRLDSDEVVRYARRSGSTVYIAQGASGRAFNMAVSVNKDDLTKGYDNGLQEQTLTIVPTTPGRTDSIRLGNISGGAVFNFHISNLRIYDVELTPAQVSFLAGA